jgi:hypothetical protein
MTGARSSYDASILWTCNSNGDALFFKWKLQYWQCFTVYNCVDSCGISTLLMSSCTNRNEI